MVPPDAQFCVRMHIQLSNSIFSAEALPCREQSCFGGMPTVGELWQIFLHAIVVARLKVTARQTPDDDALWL